MSATVEAISGAVAIGTRTLLSLIEASAADSPAATALLAPDRRSASYSQLVEQLYAAGDALHALGLGRGDRIALALPDSPESAVATIAVMAFATAAPLNIRFPEAELRRQLTRLSVRAIVVPSDAAREARVAARELGITVIELHPDGTTVGQFQFSCAQPLGPARDARACDGNDLAIVAHTSGTTGEVKVVPLTQNNVLSTILANCAVLGFTPSDRCLSVMPLCHMHGMGAVLCSLLSGGSVVVMPGFNADPFFAALGELAATWYTAVPTIHMAILERAAKHAEIVARVAAARQLRFVRSGSAPIPRGVPEKLEALFDTVYVEACGATEASAYICSNRPSNRRIGSVGMPMPGMVVRIIDETGQPAGPGVDGELAARGPGIFAGYEGNPSATAAAFADGYFRTGDLARCDADGFYYITGRIKEQINRAGMKVSPGEVDEALRGHSAVVEAVTFALPDESLGEEVAAAVVLRPGHAASELELQRHAARLLSDYKVPRRIVFLEQIPKGPSGKIIRVGLAAKLGLTGQAKPCTSKGPGREPQTPIEQELAAIWSAALGTHVPDVDTEFHILGGDSLQAVHASLAIERRFGRTIPVAALSTHPTIRKLARVLEDDGWRPEPGAPVVLKEGDADAPALFVLPGIGGNVYSYHALAHRLPASQRVIGLPLPGADGLEPPVASVDAVADRFTEIIRTQQPRGPYLISGYSLGGRIAFEVAHRLLAIGAKVPLLAMIDTAAPGWPPNLRGRRRFARWMQQILKLGPAELMRQRAIRKGKAAGIVPEGVLRAALFQEVPPEIHARQKTLIQTYWSAARKWVPAPIDLPIALFRAESSIFEGCDTADPQMGWGRFTRDRVRLHDVRGLHGSLFHEPHVSALAALLAAEIGDSRKLS